MVDATDWYDDFISEENKDEKIVELTDIADEKKASSTTEDIIDLTDIAGAEKIPSAQEDIIELTDIVDEEKDPPIKEDIIELTDIADEKKASSTTEDIIDLTDIAGAEKIPSAQEDIIELTDIANEEKVLPAQEDILELTDIVGDKKALPDMDSIKEEGFKSEENLELEDDTSFTEGTELKMEDPVNEESLESDVVAAPETQFSVSQEQLEAALEKVIEKKFADKIEFLLLESMEKVIKKEIIEIKERLQKDLDQLEIV